MKKRNWTSQEKLRIVLEGLSGQIEITKGLRLETASRASAVTYLQIVLAYTWGILLFGEYPNALSIVGALLVVFGVFAVTRPVTP